MKSLTQFRWFLVLVFLVSLIPASTVLAEGRLNPVPSPEADADAYQEP